MGEVLQQTLLVLANESNESVINRECDLHNPWPSAFSKLVLECLSCFVASPTSIKKKTPAKKAPAEKPQSRSMLVGYARVSTQDQNLELQTEALHNAGCKKIFKDRISGSRAERPGLAHAQDSLREGDTLVVWKLDRLGRSVKHLVDFVGELQKQGVQFKSLTDSIDTGTVQAASSSTSWRA